MDDDEELVLGGARRLRLPPKVLAVLALVAALGAGFGLGYYARGSDDGRGGSAPRSAGSVPPRSVVTTAAPAGSGSPEPAFEAVSDTDERCSVQHGSSLQVGVELMNSSARSFVISYVRIVLPLGGLRPASVVRGTCGEVAGGSSPAPGAQLDPGGTLWLTTQLAVLTRCPAALPVQFEVHFVDGEQVTYGFADLGDVPYSGCH